MSKIEEFCIVHSPIGLGSLVRSHTIIYPDTLIGSSFTTGHHVLIRENCRIGNKVSIGSFCDIEDGVEIGNNVSIHSRVFMPRQGVLAGKTGEDPERSYRLGNPTGES